MVLKEFKDTRCDFEQTNVEVDFVFALLVHFDLKNLFGKIVEQKL